MEGDNRMKRVLQVVCVLLALSLLACCAGQPKVKETFNGPITTYTQMSDGTWQCEGYSYAKKLVISGRMPNVAADSTFVYLTNLDEITFEQAYRAVVSSSTDDFFAREDAILVDMMTGQPDP